MNIRHVFRLLGLTLRFEALSMLLPLSVALGYGDGDAPAFALTIGVVLLLSVPLGRIRPDRTKPLSVRDGYASVAIIWLGLSFFGAMPFVLSGALPGFASAFFEVVSGFTTTGATVSGNVEAMPRGVLLWRSQTCFLGGLGILIFALAIFSQMGGGAHHLLRAESPGPMPGKLLPKLGETAKMMCLIYITLVVVLTGILVVCGMSLFDAVAHSFPTIATGGFSTRNLSIAAFHSPVIEIVITVFMWLSGVNFALYFLLLSGQGKKALRSEELRAYGVITLGVVAVVAVSILGLYQGAGTPLRHAFFQVTSMMTTTGYSTQDFVLWPQIAQNLLLLVGVMGACAGSTAGGFKIVRLLLLGKVMRREIGHIMHPRMVRSIKLDGKVIDNEVIIAVLVYAATLLAFILGGFLLVSLDGHDFTTSLTAVLTCVSNIGPGLGQVGPMGNFSIFSPGSQVVLSFLMLLGRLEIYPILLLFSLLFRKRKAGGFA